MVKVSADCDKSRSVKHCESKILGLCVSSSKLKKIAS